MAAGTRSTILIAVPVDVAEGAIKGKGLARMTLLDLVAARYKRLGDERQQAKNHVGKRQEYGDPHGEVDSNENEEGFSEGTGPSEEL